MPTCIRSKIEAAACRCTSTTAYIPILFYSTCIDTPRHVVAQLQMGLCYSIPTRIVSHVDWSFSTDRGEFLLFQRDRGEYHFSASTPCAVPSVVGAYIDCRAIVPWPAHAGCSILGTEYSVTFCISFIITKGDTTYGEPKSEPAFR
jgi:hypothetical protein